MRSLIIVMVLAASAVAGAPKLEPSTSGTLSVSLPKGWKVTAQSSGATIFVAQQNPAKPDAAAVLVTIQPTGNTMTEDQLLDAVAKQAATNLKVSKREALKGGGHVLIADGTAGTVKVRIAAIAVVSGGGGIMGVLVAKPSDFTSLGGATLVTNVIASIKAQPAAETPPATTTTTPPAATTVPAPATTDNTKITIASLAGVWDNDSGSVKQYATSSGQYAGAAVVSMHKVYTIGATGDYSEKFSGYMGGTASGGGVFSQNTYTGKMSFTPKGTLEVTNKGAAASYYTIVSLTTDGNVSTLMLAGPTYGKDDAPDSRCPCEKLYRVNAKK